MTVPCPFETTTLVGVYISERRSGTREESRLSHGDAGGTDAGEFEDTYSPHQWITAPTGGFRGAGSSSVVGTRRYDLGPFSIAGLL